MRRPQHFELTGEQRHRRSLLGKLILQVEYWDSEWVGQVLWLKKWRDARVTDMPLATTKSGTRL